MRWKILAVCLLILTSGCVIPEPFNTDTSVGFSGDLETNETKFRMSGLVVQGPNPETLDDVSVCGYSEQGRLLFAERLPPFEGATEIDIRSNATPKHIIIYSEEFWGSDEFWRFDEGAVDIVKYFEYLGDSTWDEESVRSKSELPIDADRPKQNGCPA